MFGFFKEGKLAVVFLTVMILFSVLTVSVLAGDPEEDSVPALFFQSEAGELKAWLMDGEEREAFDIFASVDPGWQAKAIADMNGDGHPDIYFLHTDGRLKVWLMEGLERVDTVYPRNPGTGEPQISPVWDMMAVADLNDSGEPDIIWQALEGPREGDLAIWLMDGLNADRFGRLYNHPGDASVSPLWEIGAVFDLLGDGQPEVIWQSVSGGAFDQLAYWQLDVEGDEFTRSASARLTHVGDRAEIRSQWRLKAAVDLMGDGQHEIIFQGIEGAFLNRVSYWVMDGPARISGGHLEPDSVSPGWSLFGAKIISLQDDPLEPPLHSIDNIVFDPESPATLEFGENVDLTFDYSTTNPGKIQIWARPMTEGALSPNWGGHGSPQHSPPTGSGRGFFRINHVGQTGDQHVDQVRFRMRCVDTGIILHEFFVDVDYTYEPPGFDHDFGTDRDGLEGWDFNGTWTQTTSQLQTDGETDVWSSAWYTLREYSNFEYTVRMQADDRPDRAQYIVIRAGEQFTSDQRSWYPGYIFGYDHPANNYSIWRRNTDGTETALANRTATAAIVEGWNTLKVRADNNRFDFYINDTLVETVFDGDFTVGKVGFTMWSDEGRFSVSRATLTVIEPCPV